MPMHPALVHLPIGLALMLPLVAGAIAYSLWRQELPRKAWALAVGMQGVLVLATIGAMGSGAADEAKVRAVVPLRYLEHHAAAGTALLIAAIVALAISCAFFLLRSIPARRAGLALAMVAILVVAGLALRVGRAGGELVYAYGAATGHQPAGVLADR